MKLITVAHQKGGVGKTTLVVNLAAAFAQVRGSTALRVALVDTDLQQSLTGVVRFLDNVSIEPLPAHLPDLRQLPYDIVLIDTPPYLNATLPELFAQSDLVIVPTRVGVFDLGAIRSTIAMLQQAITLKPELQACVVLNMVNRHSPDLESFVSAVNELSTNIRVCDAQMGSRVSFSRSPLTNGVINGTDRKAKQEMQLLTTELINHLKTPA